jgi:hypothetical protein
MKAAKVGLEATGAMRERELLAWLVVYEYGLHMMSYV